MNKHTVAVIGVGNWGPNLVRTFDRLDNARLKYVCDKDKKKLDKIEPLYPNAKFITNYKEILKDKEIDAVVVAVEVPSHYEVAKACLEADKHVFVEKPIADTSERALELLELAKKKNKKLMVDHLLKYHPGIVKMKEYVKSGEIGDVLYVKATRTNLGKLRKDENVLWSFAPHDISVVLYLLDKVPNMVSASGQCFITKDVEDLVFLTLKFPDRKIAHISVSWLDPKKERKMVIVGTKKMIVFDDLESSEKIRIYDKGVNYDGQFVDYEHALTIRMGDILIPNFQMDEPLKLSAMHFLECIEHDKTPTSDAEDGLNVVKIMEAAQESMTNFGQPIKIK